MTYVFYDLIQARYGNLVAEGIIDPKWDSYGGMTKVAIHYHIPHEIAADIVFARLVVWLAKRHISIRSQRHYATFFTRYYFAQSNFQINVPIEGTASEEPILTAMKAFDVCLSGTRYVRRAKKMRSKWALLWPWMLMPVLVAAIFALMVWNDS